LADERIGDRVPRWLPLLLVLLLGLALSVRLGEAPVEHSSERRCADIIEGMVTTGDWLVPRRAGGPWLNKPPLLYWLGSTFASVTGHLDRATLRLPSVLAALGLACAILAWGRRLRPAGLGVFALALFAIMSEVHTRGREGTAEMTLALTVNLAWLAFDAIHHAGRTRLVGWFAVALAFAVLAKATAGVMLVGLPIAVHLAVEHRLGAALRRRWPWVVAALVAGFAWYGLVIRAVPEAWDQFLNAAATPAGVEAGHAPESKNSSGHYGPWYLQMAYLVEGTAPACLLLPLAIWRAVRTKLWAHDRSLRFLAIAALSLLVAFSIIPQKRPHYLLPTFPALALLMAESCEAALADRPRWGRLVVGALSVAAGVPALLLTGVAVVWLGIVLDGGAAVVGLTSAVGLGLLGAAVWRLRGGHLRSAGLLVATVWLGGMTLYSASIVSWRAAFDQGVVAQRPDFDRQHWDTLRERYPQLLGAFHEDDSAREARPEDESWILSAQDHGIRVGES